MDAIAAVLKDLYLFVWKYHFGLQNGGQVSEQNDQPKALPEPFSPVLLAQTHDTRAETYDMSEPRADVGFALLPDTFLHSLPTRTFDGVVERLPYAASFRIISSQGKWLKVDHHNTVGWIHEDNVTRSRQEITPRLIYEEKYGSEHVSTLLLRASIDDQFHAAALSFSLQDVEYVTYKLLAQGQCIVWPPVRPRIAGTWQRILKGVQGIHLGIAPKKGSVIEYIKENNTGHVAFVESVYPDDSITISEVGYPNEGVFHERTLPKEEWKELRPIFIEVV